MFKEVLKALNSQSIGDIEIQRKKTFEIKPKNWEGKIYILF